GWCGSRRSRGLPRAARQSPPSWPGTRSPSAPWRAALQQKELSCVPSDWSAGLNRGNVTRLRRWCQLGKGAAGSHWEQETEVAGFLGELGCELGGRKAAPDSRWYWTLVSRFRPSLCRIKSTHVAAHPPASSDRLPLRRHSEWSYVVAVTRGRPVRSQSLIPRFS